MTERVFTYEIDGELTRVPLSKIGEFKKEVEKRGLSERTKPVAMFDLDGEPTHVRAEHVDAFMKEHPKSEMIIMMDSGEDNVFALHRRDRDAYINSIEDENERANIARQIMPGSEHSKPTKSEIRDAMKRGFWEGMGENPVVQFPKHVAKSAVSTLAKMPGEITWGLKGVRDELWAETYDESASYGEGYTEIREYGVMPKDKKSIDEIKSRHPDFARIGQWRKASPEEIDKLREAGFDVEKRTHKGRVQTMREENAYGNVWRSGKHSSASWTEEEIAKETRRIEKLRAKADKYKASSRTAFENEKIVQEVMTPKWTELDPYENSKAAHYGQVAGSGLGSLAIAASFGPTMGALVLSEMEARGQYDEARAAGLSPSEAFEPAAKAFIWNYASEKLPLDLMKSTKGGLRGAITGTIAETIQEVTQEVGSNKIAKDHYDPERKWYAGTGDAAFGGGFSGGVVGGTQGWSNARRAGKPIDSVLIDFGADPNDLKKLSFDERRRIREALVLGVNQEAGHKIVKTEASRELYDKIQQRSGFDFRKESQGIESEFNPPMTTDADGKPTMQWTFSEGGVRQAIDPKTGIMIQENADGTIEVFNKNRNQHLKVKNAQSAIEIAHQISIFNQTVQKIRNQKLDYLQDVAGRLAGNIEFQAFETVDDFIASHPDVASHQDFSRNIGGVRLENGTVAIILDNVGSPYEMLKTVMHEGGIHGGLREMFQDEGARNEFLKQIDARAIMRGLDVAKRQGYDPKSAVGIEEALAYLYDSRTENPSRYQRAVFAIHDAMRKVFPNMKFTKSDVDVMVSRMQHSVRGDAGFVENMSGVGDTTGQRVELAVNTGFNQDVVEKANSLKADGFKISVQDFVAMSSEQQAEFSKKVEEQFLKENNPSEEISRTPVKRTTPNRDERRAALIDGMNAPNDTVPTQVDTPQQAPTEAVDRGVQQEVTKQAQPEVSDEVTAKEEIQDLESSMRLKERYPQEYQEALEATDGNEEYAIGLLREQTEAREKARRFRESREAIAEKLDNNEQLTAGDVRILASEDVLGPDLYNAGYRLDKSTGNWNHINSDQAPVNKTAPITEQAEQQIEVEIEQAESEAVEQDNQAETLGVVDDVETKPVQEGVKLDDILYGQREVTQVPVDEINVQLPGYEQFKQDADPETGEVAGQELIGEIVDIDAKPIIVLQLNDGRKVVVTGRHRLALYKRNGMKTIPARVIYESEGVTPDISRAIDAISNILDEKGTISDYIKFFRETGISEERAKPLLSRPSARTAYSIYKDSSPFTQGAIDWDGTNPNGISPEQAGVISHYAPMSESKAFGGAQAMGVRAAKRGMKPRALGGYMQALVRNARIQAEQAAGPQMGQMDLFSGTEWDTGDADSIASKEGVYTQEKAKEFTRLRSVLSNAVNKPDSLVLTPQQAKELGITDKTDKKQLRDAWSEADRKARYWGRGLLELEDMIAMRKDLGLSTEGLDGKPVPAAPAEPSLFEKPQEKPVEKPKPPKLHAPVKAPEPKVVAPVKTVEKPTPRKIGPKESTNSHTAIYNGKEVKVDSFKQAAMRVSDNLKTGEHGYVKSPDGKLYEIVKDKKTATLVPEMRTKEARQIAELESQISKAKSDNERAVLTKRLEDMKAEQNANPVVDAVANEKAKEQSAKPAPRKIGPKVVTQKATDTAENQQKPIIKSPASNVAAEMKKLVASIKKSDAKLEKLHEGQLARLKNGGQSRATSTTYAARSGNEAKHRDAEARVLANIARAELRDGRAVPQDVLDILGSKIEYNRSGDYEPIASNAEPQRVSDDIRFRKADESTKRLDVEYMAAVNSGDMATAQKMVDEAAKRAGYTTVGYHGARTGKLFHVFDGGKHFFSSDPEVAKRFAQEGEFVLVIDGEETPISRDTLASVLIEPYENADWHLGWNWVEKEGTYSDRARSNLSDWFPQAESAASIVVRKSEAGDFVLKGYLNLGDYSEQDYVGKIWSANNDSPDVMIGDKDGFVARNIQEGGVTAEPEFPVADTIVVAAPSQIKSADAVTYDDAGRVIPLSERFNEASDDIRFRKADEGMADTLEPDNLRQYLESKDVRGSAEAIGAVRETIQQMLPFFADSPPAPAVGATVGAEDSPALAALASPAVSDLSKRKIRAARIMRAIAESNPVEKISPEELNAAFEAGEDVSVILPEFYKPPYNKAWPISGFRIRGAGDIAALSMQLRSPYQEMFKAVYLDKDNVVIDGRVLTVGLINASLVTPHLVFSNMPEGTTSIVIGHNHPTGDPNPSPEDIQISKFMLEAGRSLGVKVVDHVITDGTMYYSMRDENLVDFDAPQKPGRRGKRVADWAPQTADWEAFPMVYASVVNKPEVAQIVSENLRYVDSENVFVYVMNNKMKLLGVSRIKADQFEARDKLGQRNSANDHALIAKRVARFGASNSFFVDLPAGFFKHGVEHEGWFSSLKKTQSEAGLSRVNDVFWKKDGEFWSAVQGEPLPGRHSTAFGVAETGKGVRYSLREQDAAYMDAVNSGDMATAQKMVDEAAKRAMPDTKVVGHDGLPKRVYHITPSKFTVFRTEGIGMYGRGAYFTTNRDNTSYSNDPTWNMVEAFIDVKNPFDSAERKLTPEEIEQVKQSLDKIAVNHKRISDFSSPRKLVDSLWAWGWNERAPTIVDVQRLSENLVDHGESDRQISWLDQFDGIKHKVDDDTDYYAVFDPSQIKSADAVTYDDAGRVIPLSERFNEASDDIRFRKADEGMADTPTERSLYTTISALAGTQEDDISLVDKVRVKTQDFRLPIRRMYERIMKRPGATFDRETMEYTFNAERRRSLFSVKREEMSGEFVAPILTDLKSGSWAVDDLDRYAQALHAPYYNRMVADRRNGTVAPGAMADDLFAAIEEDGWAGKGLSDSRAEQIVANYNRRTNGNLLQRAAEKLAAMNRKVLDQRVADGLMSKEQADLWKRLSPYYVPLKVLDAQDGAVGVGGKNLAAKESKRAIGHFGKENASSFINSLIQMDAAINRGLVNKERQNLWRFLQANPDASRYVLRDKLPSHEKTTGKYAAGTLAVTTVPDMMYLQKDGVVPVKFDGAVKYIEFIGPAGAAMGKAVKETTMKGRDFEAAMRPVMHLYKWMRTMGVLDFALRNGQNDAVDAFSNMAAEGYTKEAARAAKIIPSAWKMLVQHERGKTVTGPYAKYYEEYKKSGSPMANKWVDATGKTWVREVELSLGVHSDTKATKLAKSVIDNIEKLNTIVEIGTRFSVYTAMRENGKSVLEAAEYARNITVDFERKGEWTPILNTLWAFSNVAIQGNARFIRAVIKGKHGRRFVGAVLASAFLNAMLNMMLSEPDDEDDEDEYMKIPDYIKKQRILLHIPGTKKYATIRARGLPGWLWWQGTALAEATFGRRSWGGFASQMPVTLFETLNPMGQGEGLTLTATPSLAAPFIQQDINKKWTGRPIVPGKDSPWMKNAPRSTLAYESTPQMYKATAKYINAMTGGDAVTSGKVDVSPEIIKHWVDFAVGSFPALATRSLDTTLRLARGEEVPVNSVPVLRDFMVDSADFKQNTRYYEAVDKFENLMYRLKNYKNPKDRQKVYSDNPYMRSREAIKVKIRNIKALEDKAAKLQLKGLDTDRIEVVIEKRKKELSDFILGKD